MMFTRDRLTLRNFPDTIHQAFFRALETCGILPNERIMLLVEKKFHIKNPIDGGSQQLYNMLWDVDLKPNPKKLIAPSEDNEYPFIIGADGKVDWNKSNDKYFNPDVPTEGLWLSRGTLWL